MLFLFIAVSLFATPPQDITAGASHSATNLSATSRSKVTPPLPHREGPGVGLLLGP